MPNARENGKRHCADATSYLPTSILVGGTLSAAIGALCGLSGLCRFEDAAQPWEHAIAIGWSGGIYGALAGAVVGIGLDRIRCWGRKRVRGRNGGEKRAGLPQDSPPGAPTGPDVPN